MRKVILFAVIFFIPGLAFAQTYGSDFLTGGTVSCDSQFDGNNACTQSVDNNLTTPWATTNTAHPHWWKYDLGNGITKEVAKIRMYAIDDQINRIKEFGYAGSQDDSTYVHLATTTRNQTNGWEEFTRDPTGTAYRYYKITFTAPNWNSDNFTGTTEFEMMECTDCGAGSSATSTPADTAIGTFANVGLYGMILILFISVVYFIKKI